MFRHPQQPPPHCSAHALAIAGASIAAENDATEPQLIGDLWGWESPKQAAVYGKKATASAFPATPCTTWCRQTVS